jgi:hypothetical protein
MPEVMPIVRKMGNPKKSRIKKRGEISASIESASLM